MSTGQDAPSAESTRTDVPEDRYGKTRAAKPARWRRLVFGVVALLVSGGIAYVAYTNFGSAPIEGERVLFEEKPGDAMEITINVTRDDVNRPGVCVVRVRDKAGAESGRKEVLIQPGSKNSRVTTTIKSIGRPVTADIFGCSYDVPRYLSRP
ncbi:MULTISPECIES: DUF4307 domain-containing protein [Amycolatopsis]|uniref:DUF4307 domain-containing protein n=1 Tax=Amycolatopsis TaxID=1813 RepID=UPI001C57AF1D|nr:DUF4307 domain-containing protein [Amycolatopsis sp. TNS106]QXV61707.1 DUF4307 domain-containing protein [Amycolatopsis sp. TNS106]